MIVTSQVTVAGTAVPLVTVPAGPCAVTVTNGGAATLFVGAGTSVTVSDGVPVPASGVVPLAGFQSSSSVKLWGITAGSAVTAGVFVSNGG